uniref:ER membrane protein complex subunit 4 n=1 Tax=Romanomermis culicivorax TaxID=13658 RepID=A0A915L5M0_ROMCU
MTKHNQPTAALLFQKWKFDTTSKFTKEIARPNDSSLCPPGYSQTPVHSSESASSKEADQQHLLYKRAWDIALGPVKQIPMNIFIMFMAGNSISIFPIMMVGMMFIRPIQALLKVGSTFKPLQGSIGNNLYFQKFVFMLGNLMGLALALYKCSSMGLLPTHQSDWLAFIEEPVRVEYSGGGATFF